MSIVVLQLPDVKGEAENRPNQCPSLFLSIEKPTTLITKNHPESHLAINNS